jgi:hypothetical protein
MTATGMFLPPGAPTASSLTILQHYYGQTFWMRLLRPSMGGVARLGVKPVHGVVHRYPVPGTTTRSEEVY